MSEDTLRTGVSIYGIDGAETDGALTETESSDPDVKAARVASEQDVNDEYMARKRERLAAQEQEREARRAAQADPERE